MVDQWEPGGGRKGSRILIASLDGRAWHVTAGDVGSKVRTLRFLPQGELLYHVDVPDVPGDLYTVSASGADVRRLTLDSFDDSAPAYSPTANGSRSYAKYGSQTAGQAARHQWSALPSCPQPEEQPQP